MGKRFQEQLSSVLHDGSNPAASRIVEVHHDDRLSTVVAEEIDSQRVATHSQCGLDISDHFWSTVDRNYYALLFHATTTNGPTERTPNAGVANNDGDPNLVDTSICVTACDLLILVNQPAKTIAPTHPRDSWSQQLNNGAIGCSLIQELMRPVPVEMIDILAD